MRLPHLLAFVGAAGAIVMESLDDVPEGWKRVGYPFPDEKLLLRIAMSPPDQGLFEQMLLDLSTPGHSSYGKHMKRDELKQMLRPTSVATAAVISWLRQTGVSKDSIVDDGDWINFVASIEVAERLLDTTFDTYQARGGLEKIRTLHYSVPGELSGYIDMIQPTTRFGELREQGELIYAGETMRRSPAFESDLHEGAPKAQVMPAQQNAGLTADGTLTQQYGCIGSATPACVRALYNMPAHPDKNIIDTTTSGFMAFPNFLDQVPRYDDLQAFQAEYAPYTVGLNFSTESINGAPNDQNSNKSGEANLDCQYMQAIGFPVPMHSYLMPGVSPHIPDIDQPTETSTNEPFLEFLTYILAKSDQDLPHTLGISYGENEQSVPARYRQKVCDMFGQLGARGVSVIFASGDTGVASACQTNDDHPRPRFLPVFPATCPWVTAVGATYGTPEGEQAAAFSTGGFSDAFPRPSWQNGAVGSYLDFVGDRWQGLYNRSGRATPDVAAQGYRFHFVDKGLERLLTGTSTSAPVFAGIIALLNAKRRNVGKPGLGFLNPWIYSTGKDGLNDITKGGSTGCDGSSYPARRPTPFIPYASWNATLGWDAVTGWGTPDYPKLLKLAMDAP